MSFGCFQARFLLETETILRLLVVVLAASIVLGVARYRREPKAKALSVDGNISGPGVFLFTSASCDSCAAARSVYRDVLGEAGFVEISWESDPGLLTRLGVEEIPVAIVLDATDKVVADFRLIPKRSRLARAARRAGV